MLRLTLLTFALMLLGGCAAAPGAAPASWPGLPSSAPDPHALIENPATAAERIVNRAKEEVRRGVVYDSSYRSLEYPGGDVPQDRGACTEVVTRALREAGYDLQKLMHDDMRRRFYAYPRRYGLRRPDRNIDHRRCANQMVFFRRFGRELPRGLTGQDARTWEPGDIVYVRLSNGLLHTGICSNVRNAGGLPLVIHNMSRAVQEDVLGEWQILGHFRYPAGAPHGGGAAVVEGATTTSE